MLILRDAVDGARRFSEFQKGLGLSKPILATRLRNLVALGILEMQPASDASAYQDYVLTRQGRALFPVLVALRQWGEEHCFRAGEPHSVLVEQKTGQRIGRLEIRTQDGRILDASHTVVHKVARPHPIKHTKPRRAKKN